MIARTFKFFRSYFFHAPLFVLVYSVAFFLKGFSFAVSYYSKEEIKEKIKEGKSMIRIGDGEVHMLLGGDLSYQKYEKEIETALKKIIDDYTDESRYLLGVNELVMDKRNDFLKTKNKFYLWLPMKVCYFLYFNKLASYFDASIFYYDGVFDYFFREYLKDKKVVVVSLPRNIEKLKTSSYADNVSEYIEVTEPNPHDSYATVQQKLSRYKGRQDIVVLLSCGPTSKVLAYEFCEELQCIDIGIGLEVLLGRQGLTKLLEM